MRHKLESGKVVDSKNALHVWEDFKQWDGQNHISRTTGSQWDNQYLYLTKKGTWWVEQVSRRDGVLPIAWELSEVDALKWLVCQEGMVPDELAHMVEDVLE